MKWAESYRVVAESSSSFTLRPHASSLSSGLELLCGRQLLPPTLSLCGSLCRSPPLICGEGVRGGASATHRLCRALLLLVLPDVAALPPSSLHFGNKTYFLSFGALTSSQQLLTGSSGLHADTKTFYNQLSLR